MAHRGAVGSFERWCHLPAALTFQLLPPVCSSVRVIPFLMKGYESSSVWREDPVGWGADRCRQPSQRRCRRNPCVRRTRRSSSASRPAVSGYSAASTRPLTTSTVSGYDRTTMPDATVAEVRQAFKDADTFSAEVGEFRQDVVIPVHNQLRNAGFHIVNALNDDGSVTSPSHQLYDARDHCRRAAYDAAVAGIISARTWIDAFREDYRGIVVKDVVPTYPDIILRERKGGLKPPCLTEFLCFKSLKEQQIRVFAHHTTIFRQPSRLACRRLRRPT